MEGSNDRPPKGFGEGLKYAVGIEGSIADHFKSRVNPWTIGKEIFNHVTDKVIPQGADEVANALFNGSAYLPWPGQSGPKPVAAFSYETPPLDASLHGEVIPPEDYEVHPGNIHGSLEGPIIDNATIHQAGSEIRPVPNKSISYDDKLNDAANRGGTEQDQSPER